MSGKLKTKGNMMLATKLDGVLKVSYYLTSRDFTVDNSNFSGRQGQGQTLNVRLVKAHHIGLSPLPLDLVYYPSVSYASLADPVQNRACSAVLLESGNEWGDMHCETTTKREVKES